MPPQRVKKTKCNYYNPETGDPDPTPCPRASKVCWYIHPDDPEWDTRGKRLSSPPKRLGPRKSSLGSRTGRGRSKSRTRTRSRSRSRSRGRGGRGRSRSRSRTSERYTSPNRRRARYSSPPRRPQDRAPRTHSPRPRSRSRSRRRDSPPPRRNPRDRRQTQTSTPISSSRGHTPPGAGGRKLASPPRRVKAEPTSETVPVVSSRSAHPILIDMDQATTEDRTSMPPPRGRVDHHQRPPLSLPLGEHPASAVNSPHLRTPLVDPQSPIFAPETPVIPGFPNSAPSGQPDTSTMAAIQRSIQQVMRNQPTNNAANASTVLPGGGSAASHSTTIPEPEKTEIWTKRFKVWADLMKAKSEVMEWQDEVKVAQSLKNRVGFESCTPEIQAQINSRISYATANLVQHQLTFESIVSQSIALDGEVSKTNAAWASTAVAPDPRATTPREIEWMEERIRITSSRMDDLERKLALQDQLMERIKAEQEAVAALPPLRPPSSELSSTEVDEEDGVLDNIPSLKRKRADGDDPRPSSRRKSLVRTITDLRETNEALTDRIEEAEGTIEGILNDVVEDPEGEESSRATRLKEFFQEYQTFVEKAKVAIEATESNSRVVEALRTETERAIASWDEAYKRYQEVEKEAMEIHNRAVERDKEFKEKEEKIASMQREIEALTATVQAFVEQQSAQPDSPLTLEQVIQELKPYLLAEMREATQPLLDRKHEELQRMLNDHIDAVRVSVYEPINLSEQVARTMVTWLEAEFGFVTKEG